MTEVSHQHNEFTLVKKLMIGILCINLLLTVMTYLVVTSNTSGLGCTTVFLNSSQTQSNVFCRLQDQQNAISSTSNNLANSFSATFQYSLQAGLLNTLYNALLTVVNIIISFILIVYNLLSLFLRGIYLVIFTLFIFIPGTFASANIGVFTGIFQTIYATTTIILVGYSIYLILNRIPFVGKHNGN